MKKKPKPVTQKHFEYLCDLHVLSLSPLIFPYILFISFIRYASVMCPFYAVLVRWMYVYVRHSFFPIRVRFLYVTYPVCVRYASITRQFYTVKTSTDSQQITILSTDNFNFYPLCVRSCNPVRRDRSFNFTVSFVHPFYPVRFR